MLSYFLAYLGFQLDTWLLSSAATVHKSPITKKNGEDEAVKASDLVSAKHKLS